MVADSAASEPGGITGPYLEEPWRLVNAQEAIKANGIDAGQEIVDPIRFEAFSRLRSPGN